MTQHIHPTLRMFTRRSTPLAAVLTGARQCPCGCHWPQTSNKREIARRA